MCPPTILDYDSYLSLTAESYVMWILIKATILNLFLRFSLRVTFQFLSEENPCEAHVCDAMFALTCILELNMAP